MGYFLLREAPGDKPSAKPATSAAADPDDAPDVDDNIGDEDTPKDDSPTEEPAPEPSEPATGSDVEDDNLDGDDDVPAENVENIASDDKGEVGKNDVVAEELRREALYDAIVESRQQCEKLRQSTDTIIDRLSEKSGRDMAIRARKTLDTTIRQCETICDRFSDIGYERVRELYSTVRERVAALSEIIKHVIDGDDDFQKTDSGTNQKDDTASKKLT